MIVRNRRKNESLLGRLFGSAPSRLTQTSSAASTVIAPQQFKLELLKEVYRSDRRPTRREFGLIRVVSQRSNKPRLEISDEIIEAFQGRMRVADSIGWYDSSLAILLPETDKEGTSLVANSIASIAMARGLSVDTEISIYPWDDELIALSDELKLLALREDANDDEDSNDDEDGDDRPPKNGVASNPSSLKEALSGSSGPAPITSVKSNAGQVVHAKHAFVKSQATPWSKRAIDISCAGAGLLVLSPVLIAAAVAIKLTSPGPVVFRQLREGKNGKPFGIYKFRTMVVDAEAKQAELRGDSEQDGPAFKLTNDPRVTPIGKYLRKSCVDELPQLLNILIGQMSLVGPRPLPIGESHGCEAWQRARLTVLPGLTCTWQAQRGRDVKFSQWMRMDLEYIERQSFWFDVKLICQTAGLALLHRG